MAGDQDRLTARPAGPLRGRIAMPGDKSISHRALILGALARGETEIAGLLESDDVLRTVEAVRAFGAVAERRGEGRWRIIGKGRLETPAATIDCGNSGTAARLLMGAAAGFPVRARFDGDAALRRRPMGRVVAPLARMGARFRPGADHDARHLPLDIEGGRLKAIAYRMPVASAQVKSAILLAALNAQGTTEIVEPAPSRDHTERMLAAMGARLHIDATPQGERRIRLDGGEALAAGAFEVPGDPSSAAFALVAALITPGSEVTVRDVLLNPLRTGLFETLLDMGADLSITHERERGGERVGDVTARASRLRGVTTPRSRAPAMIDEFPILAVAAAFAEGETRMLEVGELRAKESDRLAALAAGLEACGVDAEEEPEVLIVRGSGQPPRGGGAVESHADHRIAMSFLVMGLAAQAPVSVDGAEMIATSFPGFADLMRGLGADIGE